MTRLFTGDYSRGNLLQWDGVVNIVAQADPPEYPGGYPLKVIGQGDSGYIARFEVRDGDVPTGYPTGERSEVADAATTPVDATYWYAFSFKFDTTWPASHADWGVIVSQFKSDPNSHPTLSWGVDGDTPTGQFALMHTPQSAPLVALSFDRILYLPLDLGKWHDIKMQVHWSGNDVDGFVQVWHNGVRQTFEGGGQTFTGRTIVPGDTVSHCRQGIYRFLNATTETDIVYHTGFRMADSEASL